MCCAYPGCIGQVLHQDFGRREENVENPIFRDIFAYKKQKTSSNLKLDKMNEKEKNGYDQKDLRSKKL